VAAVSSKALLFSGALQISDCRDSECYVKSYFTDRSHADRLLGGFGILLDYPLFHSPYEDQAIASRPDPSPFPLLPIVKPSNTMENKQSENQGR